MRKLLVLMILMAASLAQSQNTSITGQITDTGSVAWANGTVTFTFQGPPNVVWSGGTFPNAPITGTLTSGGAISATNIPDNNAISPSGTQWKVTVCSATLPSSCASTTVTVTGTSQTVNMTPAAILITVPTAPANVIPKTLYSDAEVFGGWPGYIYYNNSVAVGYRVCTTVAANTCSVWAAVGGAGGGSVSSFSSGNLSPLFTTSVATATTTPALTFSLSTAAANTVFGNCTVGVAAPSYCSITAAMQPATTVNAITNDTNVTGSISAQTLTLGWTGTLAAGRLNANVVQSIVNDTNVTGSIAAQAMTLGWTGTLAKARIIATAVYNDQSNTFSTGTQDFSAATLIKLRVGAGLTTTVNGDIGYDTTNKNWHIWGNAVDNINAVIPVSIVPTPNNCVKWTVASGVITLNDAGAACGSGGFANPMTTLGDVMYGGAAGAATRLAGPTAAGTYTITEKPSGGAATAEVFSLPGVPTNPQVGTTYTYLATDATSDRAGYTSFSNAGAIAVTLPQAGSAGFGSNWTNLSCDIGAGTATITPTTSTISYATGGAYTSAAANMTLTTGQCAFIYSDNTNYFALKETLTTALALNSITAATGTATIANGNNPILWNWAQTTNSQSGMTFGETSAATSGTLTNALANQAGVTISTLTASTATPLSISQGSITATTGPPALQIQTTWNNASLVGEGILFNATDTTSGTSLLEDLRVGNTFKYKVDKTGLATAAFGFQAAGATAGFVDLAQGSTSSGNAICATANSHCIQAGTATTYGLETDAPALAQGIPTRVGNSAAVTDAYSGDANHSATVTTGSGTSITSTSLCSTTFCPVGTYRVNAYIDITTACGTSGTYVVNLIYTDDQGSKTVPVNLTGTGSVPATGVLTTTSTANFGYDSFILRSTGGASINYSTTAVACGTAGPMVGKLYLAVEPIM